MKELLEQSPLTIQEMSELLGVSRNNFYLWKSGKSIPKKATVLKLSNILNIPVNNEMKASNSESINSPISSAKTIQLLYDHVVLQNEKITQLKKELQARKKNISHLNDSIVSNNIASCSINFSYEIDYEKCFAYICYRDVSGKKEFAEALGYMENEIDLKFAIGEKYKYSEHPINTISPDDENKQMLNKINGLIKNIQLAKNQIDEWKVSTPTKYLHKSKKPILAMNVYTINFINGDGNCKIHFMGDNIQ
jgi:transcriptional regulator with XRE-family HTH domain|tara:strand:- start:895 stop:1644 length:750 start_codon:yes stop_codon:yes gene_type:complete